MSSAAGFAGAAIGLADLPGAAVAKQVRAGDDGVSLDRDERAALDHPGVDERLVGLSFQLRQERVHRDRDSRHDGGDVGVDERRQLVTVGAAKGADLGRRHGKPPRDAA